MISLPFSLSPLMSRIFLVILSPSLFQFSTLYPSPPSFTLLPQYLSHSVPTPLPFHFLLSFRLPFSLPPSLFSLFPFPYPPLHALSLSPALSSSSSLTFSSIIIHSALSSPVPHIFLICFILPSSLTPPFCLSYSLCSLPLCR